MKIVATTVVAAAALGSAWAYRRSVRIQRAVEVKEKAHAILVVDIGSSSVRASAYVLRGDTWTLVPGSLHQLKMRALANDGTALVHVIQQAVERVKDLTVAWLTQQGAFRIVGVGFSCFAMSLVGVNSDGKPVTPVLTYAGRCASQAKALSQTLAHQGLQHETYNRTGVPIHPAYAAPQLLKLQPNDRVVTWQSLVGVLLRQWLGGESPIPMSYSEASWTGLADFRDAVWDRKLLELIQIDPATLPSIQDPSIPATGRLQPAYAKRWPLLQDTPYFLALADGAAANIGSHCVAPDRIGLTVGTSAAMRVLVPVGQIVKVPRGLWCYRVSATHAIVGGALTDGGSVFEWALQTLALSPGEIWYPSTTHSSSYSLDAIRQVGAMAPAEHGLSMLPFLNGERSPGWHDDATCTISGITAATTPAHILRAALESVALRLGAIYALLGEYVTSDAHLVASGTALSSSPVWRQIIADVVGRPVWLETEAVELTSRGVAMFVGGHLGVHSSSSSPHKLLHRHFTCSTPSMQAHVQYLAARQRQDTLYSDVLGHT
ncbi:hypothetical protein, variant 1 [Aphanomyces astaci]|uniref:Carbohydrate kinase FGGY N-terminal domain-containing protein n=1 Tax=Aphanomyces astaci TaxID=112090 RepID=W4HCE5_APHAT|nr:hypothetical protein, variant 1 [Aphanomyces astaci]ETV88964.1 hypothetical protein, variant 1 [Aphanomyces astaci]|eukprot:XP_009821364.1 hypothetical protein, variant 1 [Aphanomyces astaci]